jgi:hypothetical protein
MADHLRTGLVSAASANALADRNPGPSGIFHIPTACPVLPHHTSAESSPLADGSQVAISVERPGQCWYNALYPNRFFALIKGELIDTQP